MFQLELTTWFPGYQHSLAEIRTLLRQLSAEQHLPNEARDDLVLAGSEAAAFLMEGSRVRELQLRWNNWGNGASVELEVDGILPREEPREFPYAHFPLINVLVQEAGVTETVSGRPRTTVRLVKRWAGSLNTPQVA